MDLFPIGGFVRLRSRARDKYVHADEDGTSVSLRPLGAVPSLDAVCWKVRLWPVEGGDDVLLLQNTAYGKYLSVADEDEVAPSGHRGVRAVQRTYKSPEPDPSFAWRAVRVASGQNYVRLHSGADMRCLRANGRRHRNWNNLVTVGASNGDETTMMQWRVEAIPSTPESLPLPPPPQVQPKCKEGSCCACGREGSAALCRRCAERMKAKLLAVAETKMAEECAQKHCYCLECHEIFSGSHTDHEDKSIPLGHYYEKCVAWVAGEETWRGSIFQAIETRDHGIQPYQLYKSEEPRCEVCHDVVSEDLLYGVLTPFCSLLCFVAAGGGQETVEKKIVTMDDPCTSPIGFCLTCATAVMRGEVHSGHDWLVVRTDSAGLRRVVIPDGHRKKQDWATIKKEGAASDEVLVRDDSSVRCKECQKRLATAGDSCSLQCKLDAAGREPRGFFPRPVQLKHKSLIQ